MLIPASCKSWIGVLPKLKTRRSRPSARMRTGKARSRRISGWPLRGWSRATERRSWGWMTSPRSINRGATVRRWVRTDSLTPSTVTVTEVEVISHPPQSRAKISRPAAASAAQAGRWAAEILGWIRSSGAQVEDMRTIVPISRWNAKERAGDGGRDWEIGRLGDWGIGGLPRHNLPISQP